MRTFFSILALVLAGATGAYAQPVGAVKHSDVPNCQDVSGQHLNYTQTTGIFNCGTSSSGGGGSGLFGPIMGTLPTIANTGFATWTNQGTAYLQNVATGLQYVGNPANGANNASLVGFTAPATPYSYTFLFLAMGANGAPLNTQPGIGWRNTTTGAFQLWQQFTNNSSPGSVYIENWSSPTGGGLAVATASNIYSTLIWGKIVNDGTNISYYWSYDGITWSRIYTVPLASSYLGATGYNEIVISDNCYDLNAGNTPPAICTITLMSWKQGTN